MYEINTWVGSAFSLIGSIVIAPGALAEIWSRFGATHTRSGSGWLDSYHFFDDRPHFIQ